MSGSPSTANPSQDNKEASVGEDDADGAAVAPRVKLDSDGNIILDEERYYVVEALHTITQSIPPYHYFLWLKICPYFKETLKLPDFGVYLFSLQPFNS